MRTAEASSGYALNGTFPDLRRSTGDQSGRLKPSSLAGVVESAVKRLAHQRFVSESAPRSPEPQYIEELCRALIAGEKTEITETLADGDQPALTSLNDLSAAARKLGDWWLEDRASFVEVTVATGRIFELLRSIEARTEPESARPGIPVLFLSVPGEQHTLGVRMAAQLFRHDGWEITLRIGSDHSELLAEIQQHSQCIVGLSVGGSHSYDALAWLVQSLRKRCPDAALLVCGQGVNAVGPKLATIDLDEIAGGIDDSKSKISAIWDRKCLAGVAD